LPLERCTDTIICRAAGHIGKVIEVNIESKDGLPLRAMRARVELDLQRPLKTGLLLKVEGKNLWLDFRYERLSHYCYSCGILGHYATTCKAFPCDENKLHETSFLYGSWLKAEVQEHSPFWRTFYDEEIILENPQPPSAIIHVPDSVHAVPDIPVQKNKGKQYYGSLGM